MSLTFPLSQAQFIDVLPIGGFALEVPERVETSVTAAGERLDREIGPRLWQGSISLARMTPAEAAEAAALIDLARGSGASFLVHDLHRPYPAGDPAGMILGAAAPTVASVDPDRRTLTIGGLPAAYVLTRGDLFGLSYGAAPLRRTLHRIVSGGIASGAGSVSIEVVPALPTPILTGAPVALSRPAITARIVSGSTRPGTGTRFVTDGAGFGFAQTMR